MKQIDRDMYRSEHQAPAAVPVDTDQSYAYHQDVLLRAV